jgi:hypothetical protein
VFDAAAHGTSGPVNVAYPPYLSPQVSLPNRVVPLRSATPVADVSFAVCGILRRAYFPRPSSRSES